jgi:hypothetical protein
MKEEIMLTPQSRNLLGILSMNGSTAGIFQTLKRQTTTAGFVAYAGIISATLGLWMWLWRDTTFQDKTLARTVGAALVLASFFFYPHLRRGFGTFFLILTSTGIAIAVHYSNRPMIHGNRPEIPAIVLIAIGLIAYFAQDSLSSRLPILACFLCHDHWHFVVQSCLFLSNRHGHRRGNSDFSGNVDSLFGQCSTASCRCAHER